MLLDLRLEKLIDGGSQGNYLMQSSTVEAIQSKKIDQQNSISINDQNESIVSFIEDVPVYLNDAMRKYLDEHPNWDQHRLMQAAISGYLLEKGVTSLEMRRFYTQSMLSKKTMRGNI